MLEQVKRSRVRQPSAALPDSRPQFLRLRFDLREEQAQYAAYLDSFADEEVAR